ncbi:MAG: multidrug DMT transporter permease [Pirellulaceae bacterium]|nr:multidrug DMT transporter permease [Pirellulaceae bacterium]
MYVVESYSTAVIFCIVTMLCWGSWANTQKAVGTRWRFELFYWDYVFGVLLASLVFAFTLGSSGDGGRSFLADLAQADPSNLGSALLGGVIFNAANILLVAAIALSGMAVAFPVGIGLALVLGVVVNYAADPVGNALALFAGVALIVAAILLDALAYGKLPSGKTHSEGRKGLILAVLCGILMGYFYRFVAAAMPAPEQFANMPAGKLSPYTAVVIFSLGVVLSNFVFNTAIMLRPFAGPPVPIAEYFKGTARDHLWGIAGGVIWAVGMTLSIVAAGKASFAISYGLGQGATMVAAFWGVFVWREFRDAPRGVALLLGLMFAGYIAGLALIIISRVV